MFLHRARLFFSVFTLLSFLPVAQVFAIPKSHHGFVQGEFPGAPKTKLGDHVRENAFKDKKPVFSSPDLFSIGGLVPNSRTVKYELRQEHNILVLLVEFADEEGVGPLHNKLQQPVKQDNNTDYWVPDFSPRHYHHMLFDRTPGVVSMANWYLEQSSGRYRVNGSVKGWYQVPNPEKHYGGDNPEGNGHDNLNGPFYRLIEDLMVVIGDQIDWEEFDKLDRYDGDQDGVINEPDGYVDYLMIIHSGTGQEGGGGAQGDDAIWSHRSKANYRQNGGVEGLGPENHKKYGGIRTRGPADIWILDYTVEPEDGGVGVFAHEFGHDLGIPDLYDTQPQGDQSESSTGFWTVMSSGSWTGPEGGPLGVIPTHFGAWEKEQLGWLDAEEITVAGGPFDFAVQLEENLKG